MTIAQATRDGWASNAAALVNWFRKKLTDPVNFDRIPVIGIPYQGWGNSGKLVTGVASQQVQLAKTFDNQIQTHTIQFDGPDNTLVLTGSQIRCRAEVLWMVNGNTVRRLLEVQDGASISGSAQGVNVNVFDRSIVGGATPIEYNVSIVAVPGVRPSVEKPPILMPDGRTSGLPALVQNYYMTLPAAETATWTIPPNAGVITALITAGNRNNPMASDDVAIRHRSAAGTVVNLYDLQGCYKYMPVMPNVATITLTNGTADVLDVSCLLGVDG